MRFRISSLVLVALAVFAAVCAFSPRARARQEQKPRAVRLSMKLAMSEGVEPSFYALGDADGVGGGAVVGIAPNLPSARFRSEPVHTLVIKFSRKGDGARVTVYVQSGRAESFREEKVAEVELGEGQEYAVTKLADYGVWPIRVGVIRRADVELKPPAVHNRTQAVEVSEIKIHEEVPAFELVLKNVSARDVAAVEIQERRGMMPKGAPPLFDWKSMPLIKPGGTFKVVLEFGWNSKAAPEGHVVEPADAVYVNSVLFSDGGYEGSSLFAAHAQAFKAGRKTQLARALEIVGGWEEQPGPDTGSVARELGARINALECAAVWEVATELAGRYSISQGEELDRVKNSFEAGMCWQRTALVREVLPAASNSQPSYEPRAVREWVKATREKFEQMLSGI